MRIINYGRQYIDSADLKKVSLALKQKFITSGNYVKKFENVMNVNLIGVINFYKEALKPLKKSKNSCCIVISSIMTHPYPDRVPYAISKAAIETLMQNIR
jgi:NAD(P)-dependent dehydrogenase (short-subunit alcohol dehydrogenase family)